MRWTIEKVIPTLAVPDLEVGIVFYSKLGFRVDWRWPDDSPTHAGLMLGVCSIMLTQREPSERGDVYFIVDDISACYADVLAGRSWELAPAAGSTARRPECPPARSLRQPEAPESKGYGLLDFSIVDPWGHHLTFGQVVRDEDGE